MTPVGQPLSSMQIMSNGNLQSASGSPASIQTLFQQIADSTMDLSGDCGPAAGALGALPLPSAVLLLEA